MLKHVPVSTIEEDDSFPYNFSDRNYPSELLRSSFYSPWWTEIPEGSTDEETAIVMDYDGFVEWYNSNKDTWMTELLADGDDPSDTFTAEEYLPYHLGRTISVVKFTDN